MRSRKWADYIIITSGWRHDLRCRVVSPNRVAWVFGSDNMRKPQLDLTAGERSQLGKELEPIEKEFLRPINGKKL